MVFNRWEYKSFVRNVSKWVGTGRPTPSLITVIDSTVIDNPMSWEDYSTKCFYINLEKNKEKKQHEDPLLNKKHNLLT